MARFKNLNSNTIAGIIDLTIGEQIKDTPWKVQIIDGQQRYAPVDPTMRAIYDALCAAKQNLLAAGKQED